MKRNSVIATKVSEKLKLLLKNDFFQKRRKRFSIFSFKRIPDKKGIFSRLCESGMFFAVKIQFKKFLADATVL